MKPIVQLGFASIVLYTAGCGSRDMQKKDDKSSLPNIVYILADDLGYGDVSVYNNDGKISTPNIDRLASQGMRFTDAHSTSAVSTPSRYGILTGRYCWRSRLPNGVLGGYGRALIENDRPTVASMLKERGYTTGVIGKWHLGLDWIVKDEYLIDGKTLGFAVNMDPKIIDFSRPPLNGPAKHGFDYSLILPASLDMEPYCYLRNDTLTAPLTGHTPGNDLETGFTLAFWRPGLMAEGFDFRQVLPNFTNDAVAYIRGHAGRGKPYFLYFPMPAPHTPWLPADRYKGKSGAGDYGDYVEMVDDMVGEVLKTIKESGQEDNTIVFLTSDNGPFWRPNMVEKYNHRAAGPFRGMKADAWDGGHRIPFIVRWPGHIKPGSVSNATTTLANLMATTAEITGISPEKVTAEDTYSILPVLLGKATSVSGQDAVVHHSSRGLFAVRKGDWKLILGKGSGGFSIPFDEKSIHSNVPGQLYNIRTDTAEKNNLYADDKAKVDELKVVLDSIKKLQHTDKYNQ
jgi:arylsulfatase A